QVVYYFSAYCDCVNAGKIVLGDEMVFCVPTGNFGNILAGWYAKQMGLPVGKFVCASNENNVLTDFIETGVYDRNRPFHTTISPSMDILISSNLERLLYAMTDDKTVADYMAHLSSEGKYAVSAETLTKIRADFDCGCCSDGETKKTIGEMFAGKSYLIDTHTAVAAKVLDDYRKKTGDNRTAVVVSTASPYKFAADVLSGLGENAQGDVLKQLSDKSGVKIPAPLSGLDEREVRFTQVTEKQDMPGVVDAFLN
ncbi:MAG: threonine synthase, partial [Oscillospiraceae bacterium]|nr:threonine synthase [Oscillospiraceae bacterium]